MNKTITLAAAIALYAGTAFAQVAVNPQGPLDADNDGFLTQEEFAPIADLGGVFVAIDSDGDGLLSKPEYNEGVRGLASIDGSTNDLTPEEFARVDQLTRMFSNEMSDRASLLNIFGDRGVDDTETGSIIVDDAADAGATTATDAN